MSSKKSKSEVNNQPPKVDAVLFQGDDFTITEADVDRAIADGRERVGDEFGDLLEAPTLTAEQIDALDKKQDDQNNP